MKSGFWACLFALVAVPVFAQHGGGAGGSGGGAGVGPGHSGMAPAPGAHTGPGVRGGFGVTGGRFRSNIGLRPYGFRHRFRQGYYPYAYPLLYDWGYDNDYGYGGYEYEYPPVNVVQPPAPQMIVEPAPPPVRSEIHEYQPAPEVLPAAPAASSEETMFIIVLNDGSRLSANAVWVQDNMLHYIDPDDHQQQISMRSVDRQSTRRINRERKLDLWLPAAQ